MFHAAILVIDDEPTNFDVIESFLSQQNYQLYYMSSGKEAIAALDLLQPDAILLDVMMPDMNGIDVCQHIKSLAKWQAVPIIIITALSTSDDLARCLEAGADDYVSKPINKLELRSRLQAMLRIKRQYDDLQVALEWQAALKAERIELLAKHNDELGQKVKERTAELEVQAERIRHNALHDPLTALPNRNFLLERIEAALARSKAAQATSSSTAVEPSFQYAVLFLDLDRFKVINDSLGHLFGDQLLVIIARQLETYLQGADMVARFGGDEFVFLIESASCLEALMERVEQILCDFQNPIRLKAYQLFVGVSIGIVLGNADYHEPAELIRDADIAMYQAKAKATNTFEVFALEMRTRALQRLTLESELRQALERDELLVYYQPIVEMESDRLIGLEALVRWQHPLRGFISPGEFVPIAEETGLVVPLDRWVLRQACQQLAIWRAQYAAFASVRVSVNLSAQDLRSTRLLSDIDTILRDTKLAGSCLTLEITESMLVEDIEPTLVLLAELHDRNIRVSIDDFGTGYSSLNYLHQLHVDYLKIDRSFVNQLSPNHPNYQVVNTIIALSQQLGLMTIAEGIEMAEQKYWLGQLGCTLGQGYFFAKPLSSGEIERQFCP
ncbi:putative bifunctional diguanylate cyclase/phosphodiesterase [Vacuolonema iberomarrocanum]|uniref:putative bifunctional diguanylate cyclase/phosphodiesterase n=1 Tax=Vacuolonema iberomarrocanum TaxID=3454632 RepID=UPI001A0BB50D|nr:EAL domain-containing protein [filamentous cyanobacterium LEGE 07170]